MAIYHLNVKARRAGRASAACAYIERRGKYAADHLPPIATGSGGLPDWAPTPAVFFDAADQFEQTGKPRGKSAAALAAKKAKALAEGKEYIQEEITVAAFSGDIAMPAELNKEQMLACAQEIMQKLTTSPQGILPHSWALHAPEPGTDQRNFHLHFILGKRCDDGLQRPDPSVFFKRSANGKDKSKGGAAKHKTLGSQGWLRKTRKLWETVANAHLAAAGSDERIDCRSNQDRGIDEEPGRHLAPLEWQLRKAQELALQAADEEGRARIAQFNAETEARVKAHAEKTTLDALNNAMQSPDVAPPLPN